MKVVIVMSLAECRGGGELMLLHLLQQSSGDATDWHVVFLEDGPMIGQVRELGFEATLIPSGRMREVPRIFQTARKIATLAKEIGASFLFGWCAKEHLYSGLAARMAGLPSAWYQLGFPTRGGINGLANRVPASGVVCLSRAGQDAQKALTPKVAVPLVYPGVELERFNPESLPTPEEARRQLGLPLGVPLIGIVGRLQRWKGMHTVVEAVPHLLAEFPNLQAVLIGGRHEAEGAYEEELRARISALGLTDSVRMVGLQTNAQVWMQAMDVVIHASLNEPFGIVVIEAMALGKPVVAGDSGGPREVITPGHDGLLAPYEDAPALAERVARYLQEPEFAREVGIRARARAQEFSTKSYAANLRRELESLEQRGSVKLKRERESV